MNNIKLFTDSSVNPQLKIGFGAYLLVDDASLDLSAHQKNIKIKRFENCSSTSLELMTLLWALEDISSDSFSITVYTDCQNILGLKTRCEKFEKYGYVSKTNKLLAHHELYKLFFQKTNRLNCEFIKVKGHQKNSTKDSMDRIFTLVDKSSRNALREHIHFCIKNKQNKY